MNNRQEAQKRNAVELKQTLKFPSEVLYLLADSNNTPAQIDKVSCIHLFESQPQSKCAIAYKIRKTDGSMVFIAVVYLVQSHQFSSIL